ncbi:MHC class I polypeptide-related sequence B isoform X2 [Sus scrofa]|uniref:MHC class I polypeptide-related sequence B isoform X2 n=1 Tax=Sus scrofa TaxID=9823 RepID=UPI0001E875FA|nr:MHC class I polypeptide-related sequence B isoform X2 [Sus scrofa]
MPHNLWYNFTVMAQDGSVQPTFFAEGRLDGQAFLRRERGTVEPQGLWAKNLSTETWRKETKDLKEKVEDLRKCLGEILGLQKEKGGLHSLQEIVSCEMGEDSHPRGVRRLYYDGELLLSCGLETHGCTVPQASAQTLALEMEKTCDMDELSRHYWAHVRGELCAKLQGYLKSWTSFTERTVPPAVTVTCSQALEGTDNLTCQAVSFSPQNISVAWYQDEKAVSPDTQQSGGVLPDGNGTYQTWVTLRVPQGEEQRFSCHVEHGGNHSVHAVPCGKAPGRHRWWIISGALTLVIFIVTWFCSYTKMTPLVLRHQESIELEDLQQSQVLTRTASHQRPVFQPRAISSTEGA